MILNIVITDLTPYFLFYIYLQKLQLRGLREEDIWLRWRPARSTRWIQLVSYIGLSNNFWCKPPSFCTTSTGIRSGPLLRYVIIFVPFCDDGTERGSLADAMPQQFNSCFLIGQWLQSCSGCSQSKDLIQFRLHDQILQSKRTCETLMVNKAWLRLECRFASVECVVR